MSILISHLTYMDLVIRPDWNLADPLIELPRILRSSDTVIAPVLSKSKMSGLKRLSIY